MTTARLNLDILAIVSEFLTDISDVLSFSLLCSSIRPVATRRLLSMRPVSIEGYSSVRRFHTFLFADPVTSAPYIRALNIGVPGKPLYRFASKGDPTFESLLVDIITACPQLEHVSIFFERNYANDEPIISAIAALQSLHSLTINGWSSEHASLLRQISAPLPKLVIHSARVKHPDDVEKNIPAHLTRTLEELELLYFQVYQGSLSPAANDPGAPQSFLDRAQYPAVRSLSLCCLTGTPLLDRLQHLFPALDGTLSLGLLDTKLNEHPHDNIRAVNQAAQERSPTPTWTKLDRLICDAPMLYVLAPRCPIRLVMLDKGSAETLRYAADALRENPVPRLKLTLKYGRGMMLDGVFSPELAAELGHLTLCLVYDNEHRAEPGPEPSAHADDFKQLSWEDLLDAVLASLRHLHNLTHLRVVIHSKVYGPATSTRGLLAPSEKFVDAVRGPAFDFGGAAASLARTLPSLRYLFLTTGGSLGDRDEATRILRPRERWNVSRAWRVAEPPQVGTTHAVQGGNSALVELHSDVAETIVRNEELVLSETDEYSLYPQEG